MGYSLGGARRRGAGLGRPAGPAGRAPNDRHRGKTAPNRPNRAGERPYISLRHTASEKML